jgi:hypothetical protein
MDRPTDSGATTTFLAISPGCRLPRYCLTGSPMINDPLGIPLLSSSSTSQIRIDLDLFQDKLELRRFRLEKEEKSKEQKKDSETTQLLEKVLEQISTKEEALKAGFCKFNHGSYKI